MGILQKLKQGTQVQHERLELLSGLLNPSLGRAEYVWLLGAFHGFYAPVEAGFDHRDGWRALGLCGSERRKVGLLNADLEFFGVHAAGLPICREIPRLDSLADVAGSMYVLEGATLGGAVIARRLGRTLGVGPGHGGGFFAGYGDAVRPRWRRFGQRLEMFAAAAQTDDVDDVIVGAARETFEKLEQWLLACPK